MMAKLPGITLLGAMLLPACLALLPGHVLSEPTIAKSSDKIWLANAAAALAEDEFGLRSTAINALLARAEAGLGSDATTLGQQIAGVSTRAEMFAFLDSPLAKNVDVWFSEPEVHKGSRGSSTPNFNHGTLLNTFDRVWETATALGGLPSSIETNESPLAVKLTLAKLAVYP